MTWRWRICCIITFKEYKHNQFKKTILTHPNAPYFLLLLQRRSRGMQQGKGENINQRQTMQMKFINFSSKMLMIEHHAKCQ